MMSDAAARERALLGEHARILDALAAERERTRRLEEALRRIVYLPVDVARTGEAELRDAKEIARAALDSAEADT